MDYSVLDSDFMFIWIYLQNLGSETAERLVLINILRDSLDIQGKKVLFAEFPNSKILVS